MQHGMTSEEGRATWPAELYANARPSYPREVVDAVLNAAKCEGDRPINYVDLAAGTGIFTRAMLDACTRAKGNTQRLVSLTAVEPSSSMRQQLRRTLLDGPQSAVGTLQQQGLLDSTLQTTALPGKFDTIDLTSLGLQGKVDLLTIAQAWHWCEDREAALNAIAAVLRPGGVLALVWNLEDRDGARWVAKVREAYESYEGDFPQYRHGTWRKMYNTEAIKQFEPLPEVHLKRIIPTTVQGAMDRVASKSYVSMQSAEKRDEILQHVKHILDTESDDALQRNWIDKQAGVFEYPYVTDVILLRKK